MKYQNLSTETRTAFETLLARIQSTPFYSYREWINNTGNSLYLFQNGATDYTFSQWTYNWITPNNINISQLRDKDTGFSFLHIAAIYNKKIPYTDLFLAVLKYSGLSINAKDKNKQTPLHLAAKTGNLKIVKYLCNTPGTNINAQDKYLRTPLYFAVKHNHLNIVEYLCNTLGDININGEYNHGEIALMWAVRMGHLNIVEYLCNRDDININAKDKDQNTPLHVALFCDQVKIVKYLCNRDGININAKDKDQNTPLHVALFWGTVEIVKYLIEAGANYKIKDVESSIDDGLENQQENFPEEDHTVYEKIRELIHTHERKVNSLKTMLDSSHKRFSIQQMNQLGLSEDYLYKLSKENNTILDEKQKQKIRLGFIDLSYPKCSKKVTGGIAKLIFETNTQDKNKTLPNVLNKKILGYLYSAPFILRGASRDNKNSPKKTKKRKQPDCSTSSTSSTSSKKIKPN